MVCTEYNAIHPASDDLTHVSATQWIDDDIREMRHRHRRAASHARDRGFDIVHIHATHAYRQANFLDPRVNKRSNEYDDCLKKSGAADPRTDQGDKGRRGRPLRRDRTEQPCPCRRADRPPERGVDMATAMGLVLADWAQGRPEGQLDFPVTSARSIPFHRFRRAGIGVSVARFGMLDRLER